MTSGLIKLGCVAVVSTTTLWVSLIMPATCLKKNFHSASTPYKAKRNCHSLLTPILYKMSSDPRHQLRLFNVLIMDTLIEQELNHTNWHNANTDQLIGHYFWGIITDDILANNVAIMKWKAAWCKPTKVEPSSTPNATTPNTANPNAASTTPGKPPTPEHKMSVWLTQVCHELTQQIGTSNLPQACVWNSDGSQQCVNRSLMKCKPDIILMNTFGKPDEHPCWEDVHAIIEITSSLKRFTSTIKNTLYSKAFMMFQAQQNHCFILTVTICQSKVYFNVVDQAGMVHSVALDMVAESTKFLHIFAGLAFEIEAHIGYDLSIMQNGHLTTISCNGCEFVIIATIFVNSMIHGRGTICYCTWADGKDYVLKDSWPNTSWTMPEFKCLETAEKAGIVVVPRIRGREDLMVDGVMDSTIIWPDNLGGKPPKHIDAHVHRRLVLQPYAIPLTHFQSKRELISVLFDIISSTWWHSVHTLWLTLVTSSQGSGQENEHKSQGH